MFLINTKELAPAGAAGGRSQEFAVLGATGNGEQSLKDCWINSKAVHIVMQVSFTGLHALQQLTTAAEHVVYQATAADVKMVPLFHNLRQGNPFNTKQQGTAMKPCISILKRRPSSALSACSI